MSIFLLTDIEGGGYIYNILQPEVLLEDLPRNTRRRCWVNIIRKSSETPDTRMVDFVIDALGGRLWQTARFKPL